MGKDGISARSNRGIRLKYDQSVTKKAKSIVATNFRFTFSFLKPKLLPSFISLPFNFKK